MVKGNIKIGIVGATGYTGVELLRLLAQHPQAEIVCITSRGEAGNAVADMFPSLRGYVNLVFEEPNAETLKNCDVIFFATPHGVAQSMVAELVKDNILSKDLSEGPRVIDLSADFRIRDRATWEHWYGQAHGCPEMIEQAVYGLPELNRELIKSARLVACPGCYPTSIILGLLPLLEQGLVDTGHLIASAASGVSGAGRGAKVDNLLTEVSDSFKSYSVSGHRHLPEIEQVLSDMSQENMSQENMSQNKSSPGGALQLTFVPHLLPIIRGMQATLFTTLKDQHLGIKEAELQSLFEQRFRDEPFVDVLPAGTVPQTRTVKGANMCRLSVARPQQRDTVVVLSVIDNLCKGASGQAIQCMNLMFGLKETTGIDQIAILP